MVMVDDWQAYRAMLKILSQYQARHLTTEQILDSMEEAGERVPSDPGTWTEWCDALLEVLREDLGLPPPGTDRSTHPKVAKTLEEWQRRQAD
ncbi:MAG: hypothetical protein R3C39_11660 [Dehalococcoidia bacterium]